MPVSIDVTILPSALFDGVSTLCQRTTKTVAAQATKIQLAEGIHVSFAQGFAVDELVGGELHLVVRLLRETQLRPLTYICLK